MMIFISLENEDFSSYEKENRQHLSALFMFSAPDSTEQDLISSALGELPYTAVLRFLPLRIGGEFQQVNQNWMTVKVCYTARKTEVLE